MRVYRMLILLCVNWSCLYGQQGKFMFLDIKGHTGYHLYLTEELSAEITDHHYYAGEIRLGWQSDGSKGWEHNYNYPSYGIGWYSGVIGDKEILGNPNALFGFISFPLSKQKKHVWVSEISLGIAYDLNKFDPNFNPKNDAIGSKIEAYFNYNFGGRYRLSESWDLLYGVDLTHMSNGRVKQPNRGLNMGGVNAGVSYHFGSVKDGPLLASKSSPVWYIRPVFSKERDNDLKTKETSRLVYFGMGTTQNREDEGSHKGYFNSSLVMEYQRFFHLKHGYALGLDLFYDGSLRPYLDDPFMAAVHGGYDYRMSKLTMRFQLGTYLYAPDKKGGFFMRPALQYEIGEKWFTQLGVKTKNGIVADWVELGVGVRLR